MKMNMKDRLPGIGIGICYDTKAALRNPPLIGEHGGNPVKMPDQSIIIRQKIKGVDNMLPGYQQQVERCGWIHILDSHKLIILIYHSGGYLATGDFTKNAGH
jgi:hypothetical protein